EEAAVREIKEETNMDITNVRFAAISNNILKDKNVHSITIWMMSDWGAGDPTITEPDKFIDQKWVDFDILPSPLFLAWDELLKSQFLTTIKAELAVS
ncbi:MAG: NUDIX domain-containing protein, partial [Candidatus Saccharibacteria bacterium]